MNLIAELVQRDLDALPENYKTAQVDGLIQRYVSSGVDVSGLRSYILTHQQFHRIYFYVSLLRIGSPEMRMAFIHENLLFSDWWHTDQLIGFVSDLDFERAMAYAKEYMDSGDPFIRRWGYVLFISKLCRGRAEELLPLVKNDHHYYVQMAQSWLIAELAVFQPEVVFAWMEENQLSYNINGKAIQKISDSFRISKEWKERFKALRHSLRARST